MVFYYPNTKHLLLYKPPNPSNPSNPYQPTPSKKPYFYINLYLRKRTHNKLLYYL